MTKIGTRMSEVVNAAVVAFKDYQKGTPPTTTKGRTASAVDLIQSIGKYTTNKHTVIAKIAMLLGTDEPITGADVIQALSVVGGTPTKEKDLGYPGTGPWRI